MIVTGYSPGYGHKKLDGGLRPPMLESGGPPQGRFFLPIFPV